jgi:hypothetical protein
MTTETSATVTVEYPKRWVFDKNDQGKADWVDGPIADGRFIRFEQGRTDYGAKPIVVLEIAGGERSVWLLHDALYNRFRDELQRRSMPKLVIGERITIEKLAEKVRSKNDRDYTGYRVFFLDAPAPDEEKLFNLAPSAPPDDLDEPVAQTAGLAGEPDADIPF